MRDFEENRNRQAFRDLLAAVPRLPEAGGTPAFLVITGDLGLDGVEPAQPADSAPPPPAARSAAEPKQCAEPHVARAVAMEKLAELLSASPVKDIYFVAGNNDVGGEEPAGPAATRALGLLADVQKRLAGGVALHDLSACYLDKSMPLSTCYADVPGTRFRLVGFPSYSFKNKTEQKLKTNAADQETQVHTFAALVEQAGQRGKRVLVLSHIPDLDDPFNIARRDFQGDDTVAASASKASAWNVSDKAKIEWRKTVESDTVAAIFAGHLHDSHKEIYHRPYAWSAGGHAATGKLYLAPPLAVRLQEGSPIQARGLSLVGLGDDRVTRRLYWYDGKSAFRPDPTVSGRAPRREWTLPSFTAVSLCRLSDLCVDKEGISRLAVIAIALLAAFLTVIELWKVPPSTTRLTTPEGDAAGGDAKPPAPAGAPHGGAPQGGGQPNLFQSNLAKTVITGLGGLIAVNGLYAVWNEVGDFKPLYLVWFVIFFFAMLLLSAVLQGLVEALRSRVMAGRQTPCPPPPPAARMPWPRAAWGGIVSLLGRLWRWMLSLRATVLIFADTVFAFLQGKNQLTSAALSKEIIDLQWSLVRTADRIREEVQDAVIRALNDEKVLADNTVKTKKTSVPSGDVRVNISVLSEDQSSVYYISTTRGSLEASFPKRSVAWVAIFTGEARWWRSEYTVENRDSKIILYKNEPLVIPGEEKEINLRTYYQPRAVPDYRAFVMLPFPWRGRGSTLKYQRGAIHISFRESAYLDALWNGVNVPANGDEVYKEVYKDADKFLDPPPGQVEDRQVFVRDKEFRAVLHESVLVLGEVLRNFNEAIFEAYIKPRQAD